LARALRRQSEVRAGRPIAARRRPTATDPGEITIDVGIAPLLI